MQEENLGHSVTLIPPLQQELKMAEGTHLLPSWTYLVSVSPRVAVLSTAWHWIHSSVPCLNHCDHRD
jgi:hypothetical protein